MLCIETEARNNKLICRSVRYLSGELMCPSKYLDKVKPMLTKISWKFRKLFFCRFHHWIQFRIDLLVCSCNVLNYCLRFPPFHFVLSYVSLFFSVALIIHWMCSYNFILALIVYRDGLFIFWWYSLFFILTEGFRPPVSYGFFIR